MSKKKETTVDKSDIDINLNSTANAVIRETDVIKDDLTASKKELSDLKNSFNAFEAEARLNIKILEDMLKELMYKLYKIEVERTYKDSKSIWFKIFRHKKYKKEIRDIWDT